MARKLSIEVAKNDDRNRRTENILSALFQSQINRLTSKLLCSTPEGVTPYNEWPYHIRIEHGSTIYLDSSEVSPKLRSYVEDSYDLAVERIFNDLTSGNCGFDESMELSSSIKKTLKDGEKAFLDMDAETNWVEVRI